MSFIGWLMNVERFVECDLGGEVTMYLGLICTKLLLSAVRFLAKYVVFYVCFLNPLVKFVVTASYKTCKFLVIILQ